MSRASILLSQKIAPALRFAGAALALALAATPAGAAFYEFSFNGWTSSTAYAYGAGIIETAGIDPSIPVFLRAGGINVQQYEGRLSCNTNSFCHPVGGLLPMSISSVRWWDTRNLLFFVGFPLLAIGTDDEDMPLRLTAVPGPVAGTGLPVLAGLLAAWGFLRRRGRAE